MTRYFQHRDGYVVRGEYAFDGEGEPSGPADEHGFIEVQVVPLDAVVIRRHGGYEMAGRSAVVRKVQESLGEVVNEPSLMYARLSDLANAVQYLRENPPVDEAQVKALDALIEELSREHPQSIARRLVERGVRIGGDSDV